MNYLGHLFIVVFLFTASIVCQESITNATEIPTTTTVEQINITATAELENVTTTTASPTTTLAPPTTTESPIGNWTVTSENGTICIMVVMNAEFHIVYNTTNGTKTADLRWDPNSQVSQEKSSCDDGWMVIESGMDNLTLVFAKGDKSVSLSNVTLFVNFDNKRFPDATKKGAQKFSSYNNNLFDAPLGKSYLCKADTKVSLGDCEMELKDLQVEAFRTKEESGFSEAQECDADEGDVSDIVPIAVGCALAGLVVIVLIAYLIGRRQKRQKGYESV